MADDRRVVKLRPRGVWGAASVKDKLATVIPFPKKPKK